MKTKTLIALALAAMSASVFATGNESEPIAVFTDPDKSSFWRTGKSNDFYVNIDYPVTATSVVISVVGSRYSTNHPETSEPRLRIVLPAATSVESEDVYRMTLAFSDGTVKSCLFGLVESQAVGSSATVRVAPSTMPTIWNDVTPGMVMAVPYGTTELAINNEPIDSADYGVQGWYALPRLAVGEHVFTTVVDDISYSFALTLVPKGLMLMLK